MPTTATHIANAIAELAGEHEQHPSDHNKMIRLRLDQAAKLVEERDRELAAKLPAAPSAG